MNAAWGIILALLFWASPCLAQEVDYADYAELLKKHVRHGLVDYGGLKKNEAELDQALQAMARVDPKALPP